MTFLVCALLAATRMGLTMGRSAVDTNRAATGFDTATNALGCGLGLYL